MTESNLVPLVVAVIVAAVLLFVAAGLSGVIVGVFARKDIDIEENLPARLAGYFLIPFVWLALCLMPIKMQFGAITPCGIAKEQAYLQAVADVGRRVLAGDPDAEATNALIATGVVDLRQQVEQAWLSQDPIPTQTQCLVNGWKTITGEREVKWIWR